MNLAESIRDVNQIAITAFREGMRLGRAEGFYRAADMAFTMGHQDVALAINAKALEMLQPVPKAANAAGTSEGESPSNHDDKELL